MYADAFLQLSKDQSVVGLDGVSNATDPTQNVIDLQNSLELGSGQPLYAVISIKTTFVSDTGDDAAIYWVFYASPSSSQNDIGVAQEIGRSDFYATNIVGVQAIPNQLTAGQKIVVPLHPVTTIRYDLNDLSNPYPTTGRRYIFGAVGILGPTGEIFTAGTFDIDICTQTAYGGDADYSSVPCYPTGITIA
jgi:hypothetical protein